MYALVSFTVTKQRKHDTTIILKENIEWLKRGQ